MAKQIQTDPVTVNRLLALAQLFVAHEAAAETGSDPWSYACQLAALQAQGVTETSLRWLLQQGLIEHRLETTRPSSKERAFKPSRNNRFTASSAFCLSEAGLSEARELPEPPDVKVQHTRILLPKEPEKPHYDLERRALYLGETLVKDFNLPAPNQELILKVFDEDGWPPHIDDPLPPVLEVECKKRLHDTIYRLNKDQKRHLIVFHGDGTGCGIRWRLRQKRR